MKRVKLSAMFIIIALLINALSMGVLGVNGVYNCSNENNISVFFERYNSNGDDLITTPPEIGLEPSIFPDGIHQYLTKEIINATCVEEGYTIYTCTCGGSHKEDYVNVLGHDFSSEWIVDVQATITAPGRKSRHCSRCDEITDIIEIEKLFEIVDSSERFTDIISDSWAKPGIDYVVSYGYMNGTGNGSTFSPSGTMTRAMIVSVLHRIAGKPVHSATNPFTDLESGQTWYHDAVLWAYKNGIVTGTSKTTFAPTGAVTREQMATFLYRFAKYMGYDVAKTNDIATFPDANKVGSWAYDALAWANAEGLITGAVGNDGVTILDPQGNATREQVATILMRFCKAFKE